jgi:GT2 family glycosyltransferase
MKVDHSGNVTCGIPTKNRYDTLALTLQSVALQTVKPDSVIIVDDSDQPTDLQVSRAPGRGDETQTVRAKAIGRRLQCEVRGSAINF